MTATTATEPWYHYVAERDRFRSDTADHEMTVLLDDDLYRHLLFKNPSNSFGWYEIVTWPGVLVIRGDYGTFTFSRARDMVPFFLSGGYINVSYWAEKMPDGGREAKRWDGDTFRKAVRSWAEWYEDDDDYAEFLAEFEAEVLGEAADFRESAMEAFRDFEHGGRRCDEFYEYDGDDWTFQFIWCCHAIREGLLRYRNEVTS